MKRILVFASMALLIFSCGNGNKGQAPAADSVQVAPNTDTTTATAQYFGDKINEDGTIPIADLKTLMGDKKEINVKLTAKIDGVCQKKGCWMDLINPNGENMRVTFKDYGFFMPKDASGRTAIVNGIAKIEETSIADLKEYAKDAGDSDKEIAAIKEPKIELVFEANGVILK